MVKRVYLFILRFLITFAMWLLIFVTTTVGVGKSCILTRLTKDQFDTEHNVTVGVDFGSCCIKVEDTFLKL